MTEYKTVIDDQCKEKMKSYERITDEIRLRVLETKVDMLTAYLGACVHEKNRMSRKYENMKMTANDAINREKNLEEFARQSSCPVKLRHAIEIFPKRYLFSIDDANRRQTELHSKLLDKLNPNARRTYIGQCIRQISAFTSTSIYSTKTKFESAWKRLKDIRGGFSNEVLSARSSLGSLAIAVISIYEMSSIDEAIVQWCNDELVWKPRNTELSDEDVEDVNKLAKLSVNMLVELDDNGKIFKNEAEVRYALDVVKIGAVFADNVSKQYKLCLWTVYMSDHPEIKRLLKTLEASWPKLDQANRIHLYCEEFAHLFNIVSDLDKHGPGVQVPQNCEPSEVDFQKYLDHLLSSAGGEICLVAKTLYSPK